MPENQYNVFQSEEMRFVTIKKTYPNIDGEVVDIIQWPDFPF